MNTTRTPQPTSRRQSARRRSNTDRERRQRIAREELHGGVPSPCIGVCRLDERTNICIGCYRKDSEISGWFRFDDNERNAVLAKTKERRKTLRLKTPPLGGSR